MDLLNNDVIANSNDTDGRYGLYRLEIDGVHNIAKAMKMQFDDDGKVVVLTGANGAGKSTILMSIWIALGGVKYIKRPKGYPKSEIINIDNTTAKISLVLKGVSRDIEVVRTISQESDSEEAGAITSSLKVKSTDGESISQEWLDGLLNSIAIEPMQLSAMTVDEQQQVIKDSVGIDTEMFEQRRAVVIADKGAYDRSIHHKNNALIELNDQWDGELAEAKDADNVVDVSKIAQELSAMHDFNRKQKEQAALIEQTKREHKKMVDGNNDINRTIADLEQKLEKQKEIRTKMQEVYGAFVKDAKMIAEPEALKDTSLLEAKMKTAQSYTDRVIAIKEYKKIAEQLENEKENVRGMKAKIEAINKEEAEAFSKFPVEDVTFDRQRGLIYKGVAIREASTSQKIMIGLLMSKAINPKLKLIQIRNGSLLDDNAIKVVDDFAKETGMTVMIETVREKFGDTVFEIVDGGIA